jgi:hypothetical protein
MCPGHSGDKKCVTSISTAEDEQPVVLRLDSNAWWMSHTPIRLEDIQLYHLGDKKAEIEERVYNRRFFEDCIASQESYTDRQAYVTVGQLFITPTLKALAQTETRGSLLTVELTASAKSKLRCDADEFEKIRFEYLKDPRLQGPKWKRTDPQKDKLLVKTRAECLLLRRCMPPDAIKDIWGSYTQYWQGTDHSQVEYVPAGGEREIEPPERDKGEACRDGPAWQDMSDA